MITALIDGDPIVYRDGYACEDNYYEIIVSDEDGDMHNFTFDDGNKKNAFVRANPQFEVEDTIVHKTVQPRHHAIYTTKRTIWHTITELQEVFNDDIEPVIYLSGPGNFREQLATVREYKGNRPPDKPVHYQAIRDYLTNAWDARVIHGREADDEISIAANKGAYDYVVCTIDKDLDQVPGWHYDMRTKLHYRLSKYEATRYFYVQALSGDSTDNIPGCFRTGPQAAEKLIDTWAEEWNKVKGPKATLTNLELYWWARIVKRYNDSLQLADTKIFKCDYRDRHPYEVALEQARLVKMQEYQGQLWNPPNIPDEHIEDEC